MPMNPSATRSTDNPLLQPWTRPFGLAPFELIRPDHFEPAFAQAMADQRAEFGLGELLGGGREVVTVDVLTGDGDEEFGAGQP